MGSKDATRKILKAASRKVHLANAPGAMKGQRVGIEAAGWLHRGCKQNANAVCLHGSSQEAVLYVTTRINAVLGEGGKPLVVFDGDRRYPAKAATHERGAQEDIGEPLCNRLGASGGESAEPPTQNHDDDITDGVVEHISIEELPAQRQRLAPPAHT